MPAPYVNSYWPSNFNGGTVVGTFVGLDGAPITGSLDFSPSPVVLLDYAASKTIVPRAFTVTLDASGSFRVVVPATDDPDIQPQGWTWRVTQNWPSGQSFSIEVPQDTTVDLTKATPVPDALGNFTTRGPQGLPGGAQTVGGIHFDEAGNINLAGYALLLASLFTDIPPAQLAQARANLGLGNAAVQDAAAFATPAQIGALNQAVALRLLASKNLSDLTDKRLARANLGLASLATYDDSHLPGGVLYKNYTADPINFGSNAQDTWFYSSNAPAILPQFTFTSTRQIRVDVCTAIDGGPGSPTLYRVRPVAFNGPASKWNAAGFVPIGGLYEQFNSYINNHAGTGRSADVFTCAAGTWTFGMGRYWAASSVDGIFPGGNQIRHSSILVTDLGPG